jgi:hypothetical protein
MSDDNQSKKAPWTQDPEIVKAVWGENAKVSLKSTTASDRLVNQKGSIWPTENEMQAYANNAMPDPQSFITKPIEQTTVSIKPMHSTPILNPMDSTQSLIDSVLGSRTKALNTGARVSLFLNEDDVAGAKRQDLEDFGPDDGRNNLDEAGTIDDIDFLTQGYNIDGQYVSDNDGDAYVEGEMAETSKEKIPSAKRKKLEDSDFVLPGERKFPVTTPKGVMQAVNSWGRYEGDTGFATFKANLIALAKRKGFTKSLPQKWQEEKKSEKSFEDKEIIITIEDTPLSKRLKEVASKMQNLMQKS